MYAVTGFQKIRDKGFGDDMMARNITILIVTSQYVGQDSPLVRANESCLLEMHYGSRCQEAPDSQDQRPIAMYAVSSHTGGFALALSAQCSI